MFCEIGVLIFPASNNIAWNIYLLAARTILKGTHMILESAPKAVSSESKNEKEHVPFSSEPNNLSLIYLKSLL